MSNPNPTHVFITKYALAAGIRKAKVLSMEDGYVQVEWAGGYNGRASFNRKGYALTRDEAIQQFQAAKAKKIQALQRQAAALAKKEPTFVG
jgi:tRNA(Phe) wybutosine-synthesizing methylase Tyw3